MTRILAPILLVVLLFPSLALGETVLFPVGLGIGYAVDVEDLVVRGGLFYKKSTEIPFTGTVTGYLQGKIKNGKIEGPWVSYHGNGQLAKKGTYKDGKREGPWVSYHENGQLQFKGNYKNGMKEDGPWVRYHTNGQLLHKGTYKNGKVEGPWVYYYDNGQLWRKETYKDGKQDGPWVSYNKDGTVIEYLTGTYKDGKKVK